MYIGKWSWDPREKVGKRSPIWAHGKYMTLLTFTCELCNRWEMDRWKDRFQGPQLLPTRDFNSQFSDPNFPPIRGKSGSPNKGCCCYFIPACHKVFMCFLKWPYNTHLSHWPTSDSFFLLPPFGLMTTYLPTWIYTLQFWRQVHYHLQDYIVPQHKRHETKENNLHKYSFQCSTNCMNLQPWSLYQILTVFYSSPSCMLSLSISGNYIKHEEWCLLGCYTVWLL
jgi:hypothetical protein